MANHEAPGLNREVQMANAFGNLSVRTKKYAIAAAVAQDDTIDLLRLPKGTKIVDAFVVHSALGASVTLDLGLYRVAGGATTKEDVDALIDGADVAAAGIARRNEAGVFTEDALTLDDDYLLRATLAGGNPAAGTVEVVVLYEYQGTP